MSAIPKRGGLHQLLGSTETDETPTGVNQRSSDGSERSDADFGPCRAFTCGVQRILAGTYV